MDVKLGAGKATGMFFHAPANTPLPTSLEGILSEPWVSGGDVKQDGIILGTNRSTQPLKNWANKAVRVIMTDHTETVQSPLMDTTEESLTVVVGEENVNVTEATTQHGRMVDANLSPDDLPAPRAFIWLMKDGDDLMALGTTRGQVSALENVSFVPNDGITWTPTITCLEPIHLIMDDGQKTT